MSAPVLLPTLTVPGFAQAEFLGTNTIALSPAGQGAIPIGAIVAVPCGCRRLSLRVYDPATGDALAAWYGRLDKRDATQIPALSLSYGPDGGVTVESLPPETGLDLDQIAAAFAVVVQGDTQAAVVSVQAEGSKGRQPIAVRS